MVEKAPPIKFVLSSEVRYELSNRKRKKGDLSYIGEVAFRQHFGMDIPPELQKYLTEEVEDDEGTRPVKFVFTKEVRDKIFEQFSFKGDLSNLAEYVFRRFFKLDIYEDLYHFTDIEGL
jgi:hypothetical protein